MRILLTNDDGINAPGLKVLEHIAAAIAGTGGEIWVVAPAFEQSGVGHCISYTHPMMIAEMGHRRVAAEGSPADCVLAAIHDVMPQPPDLILSGVNRGNNSGENALYSGTLGGAMEGALQGVRSIALSQFYGPDNAELDDPFEAARQFGAGLVRRLIDKAPWGAGDYGLFYNVNFPPVPAAEVKGAVSSRQGFRPDTGFSVEPHMSPSGRRFLWIRGAKQAVETGRGSDVTANLAGYISVTPMRADLTAHESLAPLAEALR
ncbi:5'/3'-nucleotidase SurE [Pseudoroseicyclus sp. CXY001]|uniref:5'/3'-nucleotidase SurE n=1 Tax=Pseudoroseicyclus sp. CXY001 TaxID=3242492 RepID=UPI003570DA19